MSNKRIVVTVNAMNKQEATTALDMMLDSIHNSEYGPDDRINLTVEVTDEGVIWKGEE